MKKAFIALCLGFMPLLLTAQIAPRSIGVYKTYAVGGPTDIFVKLQYSEQLNYFSLSLRLTTMDVHFPLYLGSSKEKALQSLENMKKAIKSGKKGEIYILDDETMMRKTSASRVTITKDGYPDPGYVEIRHLNSAIRFIQELKE